MQVKDYLKLLENISTGSIPNNDADMQGIYSCLKKNKLAIHNVNNEMQHYFKLRQRLLGKPRINMLYLSLTSDCNFHCNYCYIDKSSGSYMSKSIASHAIESFFSASEENDEQIIIFYGGEPLLNSDVLSYSVKYAKRVCRMLGKSPELLSIQLITNGSLLDTKIVKLLAEENVAVAVSLDGTKQVNDQCRKYKTGKSSFEDTLRGIELLKENNLKFSISCTIGNHNLSNLTEIFKWFYYELGTSDIGFNIIQGENGKQIDEDMLSLITDKIIECFKISRTLNIYEQRIMRTVNAFVNKEIYPVDCGGCGQQLVVTSDATYGPCPGFIGDKRYFKKLPIKNIIRDQTFIEWSNRSPLKIDACIKCEALGICGGGCPYHAYITSGNIWELDTRYCTYIKKLLNWLVRDTYYQIVKLDIE